MSGEQRRPVEVREQEKAEQMSARLEITSLRQRISAAERLARQRAVGADRDLLSRRGMHR